MTAKLLAFPSRFTKSFDELHPLRLGTAALTTQYATDAHCVTYVPRDKGAKSCPRWSKMDLAGALETLQSAWIFLDYDLPKGPEGDKRAWKAGEFEAFMRRAVGWDWVHDAGWYQTSHGMRFVRPLADPIDVLSFENLYRAVLDRATAHELDFDPACKDWTRLFRLPFVRRRGVDILPTDDNHDFSRMRPFDVDTLTFDRVDVDTSRAGALIPIGYNEEIPEPMKIRAPLFNQINTALAQTLRSAAPLTLPEGWDSGLMSALGSAARSVKDITPHILYSMFWPSVRAMIEMGWPEMSKKNLWGKCSRIVNYIRAEAAQPEVLDAPDPVGFGIPHALISRAAEAMNCEPEFDAVRQNLIVKTPSGKIVGFDETTMSYTNKGSSSSLGLIFKKRCPTLAGPLSTLEGFSELTQRELEYHHYSEAIKCAVQYGLEGNHYNAQTGELIEGACTINKALTPTYHPDIDRWLRAMGGEWQDKLLDWISLVTRVQRQLPALYIRGPASIGKTLLAHGLARIWRAAKPVNFEDAFEQYNEAVLQCPLFYVDEKLGKTVSSAQFRKFIGSPSLSVNRKFMTPCPVIGSPRVLITANNDDALTFRELMSADDIGAVRLRIGYLRSPGTDASSPAQDVLNEVKEGGTDLNHWMAGPIAQHALWLRDNREVQPGSRFLMDGFNTEFTEQMVTQSSVSGDVASAIVRMIMTPSVRNRMRKCKIGGGDIWINSVEFQSEWDAIGDPGTLPPTTRVLAKALRAISDRSITKVVRGNIVRVWTVRPEVVYASEAKDENYDLDELKAVVNASHEE